VRSHARASSAGSSTRRAKGLGRVVRGAFVERGRTCHAGGSGAPSRRLLIGLLVLAGAFASIAAPASAALPTHPELPALTLGGFQQVCGLAVDSEGNRYVADYLAHEVKVYSPSGTLITSFDPSANVEAPCGLAVDSEGDVYVNGNQVDVVKYKPSSFPPTASTTYAPDASVGSGTGVITSGEAYSVAVDPANDDVYVGAFGHISSYQPDGTLISATIGETVAGGGALFSGLGVRGSTGKVYAYDRQHRKAYVLSSDGSKILAETDGSTTQAGSFTNFGFLGLAVDQSDGHFYVADLLSPHKVVDEFDSGGELVSELPAPPSLETSGQTAVAVDNSGGPNAGDVFFAAGESPASVLAYGALVYGHELKVEKAGPGKGTVTGGSASRPTGIECGATCKTTFEDGAQITLTATPDPGSLVNKWSGCDQVLGSNHGECKLTLGADRKVTVTFSTKPAIEVLRTEQITTNSAQLNAEVNPDLENTEYHFEYTDDEDFQDNEFANAILVPIPDEEIGAGGSPVPVSAEIKGISPFTTYHFRVLATNAAGTTESNPASFTTFTPPEVFEPCPNDAFRGGASAALPDCRAYEQASPVDKNGGDVTGTILSAKASVNGNRVSFEGYSSFPGGEGAQEFDPPYLATRGPDGWSTQSLLPPQELAHHANVSSWTPDFSHVYDWTRLFGEPEHRGIFDRNTNDRSITPVVPNVAAIGGLFVTGTSDDGSIVFFESDGSDVVDSSEGGGLTSNAVYGRTNLYVWDRETNTIRLAGVFNNEQAPSHGSFAGAFNWVKGPNPNAGGASDWMYTRDQHTNPSDGSSVYFTSGSNDQLYLRINPTKPQSDWVINGDGEEECTQPDLACTIHVSGTEKTNSPTGDNGADPAGTHPAAFLGASTDGKHALFTSTEMLTNDANTGPEQPPAQISTAKIAESGPEDEDPSFLPRHALGLTSDPVGEYLYWADPVRGTIGRAKLNPDGTHGPIEDDFITPGPTEFEMHPNTQPGVLEAVPTSPRYVVVDGEYVYWTNSGPVADGVEFFSYGGHSFVDKAGTIGRAKLDGSGNVVPNSVEPSFITGASNPQGIALAEGRIYWANNPYNYGQRSLARAVLGSGAVSEEYCPVSTDLISGIILHSNEALVTEVTNHNEEKFSDVDRYQLGETGCTGNGSLVFRGEALGIAVDGSRLYWTRSNESKIGSVKLSEFGTEGFYHCFPGSTDVPGCEPDFISLEGAPFGVAKAGEHLYWSVNAEAPANAGSDLYRYDYESQGDGGKLTDLTADSEPGDPNGAEVFGILGNSDDGSTVYFVANGVLAQGATRGGCKPGVGGGEGVGGVCNLYVSQDGQITYIGKITEHDNWRFRAKYDASNLPKISRVSSDGSTVLYTGSNRELYRYQIGDSNPICISCATTGVPVNGGASLGSAEIAGVGNLEPNGSTLNRNLSSDGNRVIFETAQALVAGDTNGLEGCPEVGEASEPACTDVYEWEAKGTGSCHWEKQNGGCIYLISSGRSTEPSVLLDASASGNDVFFFTRSQLVGQDEDSFVDVYDARVDGGFASQKAPPPPPICEGEACKGGIPPAPEVGSPSTPLFSGPGNPKPHHKKAKARKHKHKRKAHKRHAKHNRRAHR
jgi:hypothetical protein